MQRFTLIVMAAALTGCSAMMLGGGGYQAGQDQRAASTVAADARITSQIISAYAADTTLSEQRIEVRTNTGTVILTGTVDSYSARDAAVRVARATSGVNVVDSQLLVESR